MHTASLKRTSIFKTASGRGVPRVAPQHRMGFVKQQRPACSADLSLLISASEACINPYNSRFDSDKVLKSVLEVEDIHEQLEDIFHSKGGYRIAPQEQRAIEATGGSSTYGELQPNQMLKLLDYMCLEADSVFYDLGSGTGKAVVVAALANVVRQAVGIELSASRHEQAEAALEVVDGLGLLRSPVDLRNEDIATADISSGTHFYLCSTAFGASLCRKIAERLSQSKNFKVLVTTRELPFQPFLQLVGDFPCDYSWIANSSAYIYVKSFATAPKQLLEKFYAKDGIFYLPTGPRLPVVPLEHDLLVGDAKLNMQPLRQFQRPKYA